MHVVMMQLSLEKCLKEFGKEGEEAVIKEMQQHHDMEKIWPRYARKLHRRQTKRSTIITDAPQEDK